MNPLERLTEIETKIKELRFKITKKWFVKKYVLQELKTLEDLVWHHKFIQMNIDLLNNGNKK